jgi:hypothetical protein
MNGANAVCTMVYGISFSIFDYQRFSGLPEFLQGFSPLLCHGRALSVDGKRRRTLDSVALGASFCLQRW